MYCQTRADTVPLAQLGAGARGVVDRIEGGRSLRACLAVQGVVPGAEVFVLQRAGLGHGGIIIRRGDTRLALGREEASRILLVPGASDAGATRAGRSAGV